VQAPAAGFAGGADAMRGGGGGAAEVGDDGFTGVQRDVAAVFKRPDAAAGTGMHNDQARTTLHTCYALPPRAAVYKKKSSWDDVCLHVSTNMLVAVCAVLAERARSTGAPGRAQRAASQAPRPCCCAALGTRGAAAQVVAALAGKHSRPQVMAAIDFLKDQGHLFTTIDDDHCQWCS